jgi:hypothetical protein
VGSREQMHAICAAEYAGSHLCHVAEYYLAATASPVPASGAWADISASISPGSGSVYQIDSLAGPAIGRYVGQSNYNNCINWTANTYQSGSFTYDAGGAAITQAGPDSLPCPMPRPLACCATPYREEFAGFTAATTAGDVDGREQMHYRCALEFPGSHMCHVSEYARATPATTPPAAGACLDISSYFANNSVYQVDTLAARDGGRYAGQSNYNNCINWTANTYQSGSFTYDAGGAAITPSGFNSLPCPVARQVACCY